MEISTIFDETPSSLLAGVAARARDRRLADGLTQAELGDRAGVSADVVKRLEATGHVSLESLARIAMALDATAELLTLFPPRTPRSLDELEQSIAARPRRYGRRRDAGVPRPSSTPEP